MMQTQELLKLWGLWIRNEFAHLGYARSSLYKRKSVSIPQDEVIRIDGALAKVRQQNEQAFQVLKQRYCYRASYQQIAGWLGKKTAKAGKVYVDRATDIFEEFYFEGKSDS